MMLSRFLLFVPYLASALSKPITSEDSGIPAQDDYNEAFHHAVQFDNAQVELENIDPPPRAHESAPILPKFGHGAIPQDRRDAPEADNIIPPSLVTTQRRQVLPLTQHSAGGLQDLVIHHHHDDGPRVEGSTTQLIGAPLQTSTISLAGPTSTTTPVLTSPASSSTTNSSASGLGCTTTIMGALSNPCRTDETFTIHTSSLTQFSSIDCRGCTAVHVVEPMWGCPLETAGAATTTAETPYTWTSTVCEPSFILASITVTVMFGNTTTTTTVTAEPGTVTEILDTVTMLTLTLTTTTSTVDTLIVTASP